MTAFVIRITQVCNKKCPTCCSGTAKDVLQPDQFREKLWDIKNYCTEKKEMSLICFTGGEAFLYKAKDKYGKKYNIVDLVGMTKSVIPNCMVMIKTSGWTSHRVLDQYLHAVESYANEVKIDVRLGFNLYQNNGIDAEERLYHMISSILRYQNSITIDTIYDRYNLLKTLKVFEDVFSRFGFPMEDRLKMAISEPEERYRIKIPVRYTEKGTYETPSTEKMIILDTMPAYEGLGNKVSDQFFEARCDSMCPAIESGPDHILYHTDFTFNQCNDAFADYSAPAFTLGQCGSVEEQFTFLEQKFSKLKTHLIQNQRKFRTKREQCLYCSQFMRSGIPDKDVLT